MFPPRRRAVGVGRATTIALAVVLAIVALPSNHDHSGHLSTPGPHDMPMVPVPVAAQVPTAPVLPRTGWTAVASDQETTAEPGQAANVLDGNNGSIWHTRYSGTVAPLPHTITIDMKAATKVSGLVYRPRQDGGNPNGRIGRYAVSVSSDGTNFGGPVATGTWADDGTDKTAAFNLVTTRYLRLTAETEAGNRGPWTSAAEIMMLGESYVVPPADDLAIGKPATQSSTANGGVAGRAVDGNTDGILAEGSVTQTASAAESWWTVDLQSVAPISGVTIYNRTDCCANRLNNSYLLVSDTPFASTGLAAARAQAGVSSYPISAVNGSLTIPVNRTGRYLRVQLVGTNVLSLAEVVVRPGTATGGQPIDRTGWLITASDEETAGEPGQAANVLDGNQGSIWHSRYSGTVAPLPHSLTIQLPAQGTVSGLKYLPRQDAVLNGNIGGYTIAVSTDGTAFSQVAAGAFADDKTEKTVTFAAVAARFVRLTATSEAGNRGPWSSASEINLLGTAPPPPGANTVGKWGSVIGFPIVPSSVAILPNNKVLTWSAYSPTTFGSGNPAQTQVAVLDLATNQVSQRLIVNTNHEMFCTGIATLPDGRILITGGSSAGTTTIYNPANDTWAPGPPLNIPRGYQSDVTLSTGQVLTLGGSWSGGLGGKDGELYTPDGTWRRLTGVTADRIETADAQGVFRSDNHAWLFALAGGGVFHAGPSKQMNWITTGGNGTMTAAGNRADDTHAMNGDAVMYDVGKILTNGGAPSYENSDATRNAYVIDISGGPGVAPTVTKIAGMAAARAFHNSVVLPDGKVFVVGGQAHAQPFTDTTAAMSPELWNPATRQFTPLAAMAVPRTYHSVAALLPDGRVFTGGGGLCGDCATNHADAQIFTPPYLLNADGTAKARPTITTAPATAAPGATMQVTTGAAVQSFALVRIGTATHTVDTDQRRIPVSAGTPAGTTYTLSVPALGTVIPGNYFLFALDAAGTPSVAKIVNIR